MLNVLGGKDPRTVARTELEAEAQLLENVANALRREIGMRNKDDEWTYGHAGGSGYVDLGQDMGEAVRQAELIFGPDARWAIVKVYL